MKNKRSITSNAHSEMKYIAASILITQLPKGHAIDDQTLMLQASALAGDEFDAMEADELLRRLATIKDIEVIEQHGAEQFAKNSIHYFVWKRR